jgi:hypothetical protein
MRLGYWEEIMKRFLFIIKVNLNLGVLGVVLQDLVYFELL